MWEHRDYAQQTKYDFWVLISFQPESDDNTAP